MRNKLLAEIFGTFWLVFGGCGSAVLAANFPGAVGDTTANLGIGFVGVALAFGLTVLTMAVLAGTHCGSRPRRHRLPADFRLEEILDFPHHSLASDLGEAVNSSHEGTFTSIEIRRGASPRRIFANNRVVQSHHLKTNC